MASQAALHPVNGSRLSGTRIANRFVVRRFLGKDEIGERYACTDSSNQALVSVQVVEPDLLFSAPDFAARYVRAFAAVAPIRSSGVLKVIDVAQTDDALVIVSDYLEATSLAEYVAEYGAVPSDLAVELFFELAECLAAVHQAGHVHGSVCPEHILVSQQGGHLSGSLSAFVTSRILDLLPPAQQRLAPYFAPDRTEPPSIADDIFAFGASLLEVLIAARPSANLFDYLEANRQLSPEIVGLIKQCMAPSAQSRFQSMAAVRNVLHGLAAAALSTQKTPERPDPGDVVAGQYVVEKLLGEGGMARVYLARDNKLGTSVALKLLNSACAGDPTVVERFLTEASIQAKLVHPEAHPNIVAVYRILRESPVGFVMEYVPGTTLEDFLRDHVATEAQLVDVFAQICAGLEHAHQQRVIHRDLKLSNILLLGTPGSGGVAKLMDFGISKQLDQPKTKTNLVLGTLGYIAPELFVSAKDASPASDLYAIGCCLFEAFTGDVPFSVAGGLRSLAFRVYNEPAPRPSSLGAKLSPGLEALILMMLAKKPDERPPSARWVVDKLRLIQRGASDAELDALVAKLGGPSIGAASPKVSARALSPVTSANLGRITTQRELSPPLAQPTRSYAAYIFVAAAVLLVAGALSAVLLLAPREPVEATPEAVVQVEAKPVEAKPLPKPPETKPKPPEVGRSELSSSVVFGADDLLFRAAAEAKAGNRTQAAKLYLEAAAKLEEEGRVGEQSATAYAEAAAIYEGIAAETSGKVNNTSALSAEDAALRQEALDQASQAYARAALNDASYDVYMKKAAIDQERGDVQAAVGALESAVAAAANDEQRGAAQAQLDRIQSAVSASSEASPEENVNLGPLPPNMIQVWIETTPEKATVLLDGRKVGKTPLIKRLPMTSGTLSFRIQRQGYYDEDVPLDAATGGQATVKLKYKPRKIN